VSQIPSLPDKIAQSLASRYKIERPIGRGGMATVYLAEERHPRREVAIKLLDPALGHGIGRERFLREIEIVSQLTHPHVVPVFAAGEVEGLLYYVMPHVTGQSLRQRLRQGPIPLNEAVKIVYEVAEALEYAHDLDIIHRDIKPENILLEAGHAVVTDFGIARVITAVGPEQLTETGLPIGTPAYMSPEQASGERQVDGRADIYSLACVLHEILTGKRFWVRSVDEEAGTETIRFARAVPEGFEPILRKALARDASDRYEAVKDFSDAVLQAHHPIFTSEKPAVQRRRTTGRKSIVVLPFANMSADPSNEYFSDGITEDIIASLSKVPDLSVTSRTSAMHYKGSQKNVRQIGKELGVSNVLEGSVRRAGNRVRITSQLIDVNADDHIWAETYDRDLTDIFEIQSDVAGKIARSLKATLSPDVRDSIKRAPTDDLEAYALYKQGVYLWNKFTLEAGQKALKCFEEAIERDPFFAQAHAGLADAYWALGIEQDLVPAEMFQRAKDAALHALDIDRRLSDAHATLGAVYSWNDWNWPAAETEFDRATELAGPQDKSSLKHGMHLAAMGRHEEGLQRAQEALTLDPISLSARTHVALQHYWKRDYESAIEQALNTLELDVSFRPAYLWLGLSQLQLDRIDEAVDTLASGVKISGRNPNYLTMLGCALGAAGKTADVDAILGEMETIATTRYVSPRSFSLVYTWSSRFAEALEWLEKAYEQRAAWMPFLKVDPLWDSLREEERFEGLLHKMRFDHVTLL
jgi:serine/threonine protein kinase/Tfp pilus assembly protein PilF